MLDGHAGCRDPGRVIAAACRMGDGGRRGNRGPGERLRRDTEMYLTPTEEDRLRVFTAAELARRTLASGLRLNAPEAVALACDAMHLAARGGASLDEVVDAGRSAVAAARLMDWIAEI